METVINDNNDDISMKESSKDLKKVDQTLVNRSTYYSKKPTNSKESKKDNLDVPQKYIDYIADKNMDSTNNSILFYSKEDIDIDGKEEIVIATGVEGDDLSLPYIANTYIIRDDNGKIEQLGENIVGYGYSAYEIKLIRLQNKHKKYIYCGLTNGDKLKGFEIIELSNNKPKVICYSASATGAGYDEIKDFNNDGQYDGYVQERWSYDVLYFPLNRTYLFKDDDFKISSSVVTIPEYPSNIKDVVIQYLSLRVLDVQESPEVNKRLSELCRNSKAQEFHFLYDIWYNIAYAAALEIEDNLKIDIMEDKNTAKVNIYFTGEDNKEYKYSFHLIKIDYRWSIDDIK